MRLSRKRKKLGKVVVQVEVTGQEIDLLRKRGYGARADDLASVSQAVSSALSDYRCASGFSIGASGRHVTV
jgi:hypothetical protein